jgi:hypothetical protein
MPEIRKIMAPDQHTKKVHDTPSQYKKAGIVACACHPRYSRKEKIKRS